MRRLVGGALAVLVLAGCSAGAPSASTTSSMPRPDAAVPTGGVTLREMMFRHGPEDLSLPREIMVTSRIDQPNVVTITLPTGQRQLMVSWFRANLPPDWRLDASSDDAALFHGGEWQGAFTCSQKTCALTLRHQQGPA
ncbi:hypothetical protein [Luteococcus sp. OSA5]|uniref:hypothetical protein n=1 Tax=Luteococcus sp. OSA5 TaxID=3401630 RepID=UPI003B436165